MFKSGSRTAVTLLVVRSVEAGKIVSKFSCLLFTVIVYRCLCYSELFCTVCLILLLFPWGLGQIFGAYWGVGAKILSDRRTDVNMLITVRIESL